MAGWDKLTAGVIGVGVGEAAGVALEPVMEPLKQDAWQQQKPRVLGLGELAQLAASGLISQEAAHEEGGRSGFSPERVDRAIQLTLEAAPVAELLELWRRGKISEELVDHGLAKARIEPQYWKPIKELFYGRLDPAIVATAIQRGIMAAPFALPYNVDVPVGNVKPFPVSPLSAEDEAKAHGIDVERLRIETALVGLPMALDRAAQAHFRGILTDGDYLRAVLEGNARGEWADAELEVARAILTSGEYAELELRGYYDRATRLKHTAKHGMSVEDSDLLYNVLGRSVAVHAVTTGLARGGKYPGSYANVPQPYRAAIQRSNIREEYSELAYANRYSYPSAFVVRALLTDGAISQAEGEQIFKDVGWTPELATKVAQHYAPKATVAVDANVKKAHTKAWTEAQTSYIAEESTAADVQPIFTLLGVDAASQPQILAAWDAIRALVRKQLSPKEIVKAVQGGVINPATGVAWSLQEGIDALKARGYTDADARVILAE